MNNWQLEPEINLGLLKYTEVKGDFAFTQELLALFKSRNDGSDYGWYRILVYILPPVQLT
ncbi:hypothetical protein O185_23700 [Photorhabdus temperata J3]|uniref:Uncharacterized protein n=1 Tax=Photorhabdus temperata J3 TaxID=1389415 RepID=U7QW31_PHOTE|nr:hypothetical protein O185_23700 [Photorhabdus temperata J3]